MASIYRARPWPSSRSRTGTAQLERTCGRRLCAGRRRRCAGLGGGRIINFADWVAASGRPRYVGYLPYFVAKQGVIALTEALALELAKDQILVNCIAPGPIVAPPGTSAEEQTAVEQATPLGRWGGEDEIAKAALFLVETDFVTGRPSAWMGPARQAGPAPFLITPAAGPRDARRLDGRGIHHMASQWCPSRS